MKEKEAVITQRGSLSFHLNKKEEEVGITIWIVIN